MSEDIKIAVGDAFPLDKLGATGPAVVYVYPKDSTSGCELESRGFNVLLVNARHVKNVSGRKSLPRRADRVRHHCFDEPSRQLLGQRL